MKICYIWVGKFRNFENFGCNISSSYKFDYNVKNNNLLSKRFQTIPDNFFGENITDVIGIVGKNGVGKSNAVELFCKVLKGGNRTLQSEFLVITEEEGKLYCYFSFNSDNPPIASFDIKMIAYNGSISPLKVVYFSNVFDERRNEFSKEISDISVNNNFLKGLFYKEDHVSDFEKQILFIKSRVFKSLNIDVPSHVLFTSKVWTNRFNMSMERNMYGNSYDQIKDFKKVFRQRLRKIVPDKKFIHLIRFGFFFEIINDFLKKRDFSEESQMLINNLGNFIGSLSEYRTEEMSEALVDFLLSFSANFSLEKKWLGLEDNDIETEDYISKLEDQLHFLKNLEKTLNKIWFEYDFEGTSKQGIENFIFDFRSPNSKNFIAEYVTLFGQNNFFTVNWLGISSGHKAYLNIFSSLFIELRYKKHSNLFICIDEGDLYLHPMWQIEFFDKLLNVLPAIFSGKIQLVLTSHSPFLLSDLPKQNITILDKSFAGYSQDGIDLKINTFGGNLYDLYSEPFFLGSKITSDFAYHKIKEIIDIIEGKDNELSEKDKIAILKLSDIIGDEIIKYKIQNYLKK